MGNNGFDTVIEVKYRDTDSMGHVSSPVYYDYLQHAYLSYMHNLLNLPKDQKLPHIMVRTSCEYVKPAIYGNIVTVTSRVIEFGNKSFEMEHIMHLGDAGKTTVAKGLSKHVMFDYASNHTITVPDELKHQVLAFQE